MAGTMSKADLIADLKASFKDAATVFTSANDEDFARHLRVSADDFMRFMPRKTLAIVVLMAGVRSYALPADFGQLMYATWGVARAEPWASDFSGRLPRHYIAEIAGVKKLVLDPAPTQAHINDAGSDLPLYYAQAHAIGDTAALTTIAVAHRSLLILRAQAEAMRELTMRNINKPVQLITGHSNVPRNMTPTAMYQYMMAEFERAFGKEAA